MGGHELVCHYHEQHNRICLTDHMLPMVIDWFHKATAHNTGITSLQESLRFHFHHKNLLAEVRRQISKCDMISSIWTFGTSQGQIGPMV